MLAPHFAIRTENDLGIGDTGALRELVDWAADTGFRVVQLLPVNETGADNSPYNAVSASALDPTTIQTDPGVLKDLGERDYEEVLAGFDMASLRTGSVDYGEVKRLKHELLRRAFLVFEAGLQRKSGRGRKFAAWCRENRGWLDDYTLFRVLMESEGTEQWDRWPEDRRTAEAARRWLAGLHSVERAGVVRRAQYFAYVQWIAANQWTKLRKHANSRGVYLMGDIPIGVSYYSADVFSAPGLFDLGWSGGAPPERVFQSDPFTVKWGQNWGVPVYRWEAHREDGYAWWRRRVSLVREFFDLFRIDHILGFFRIYAFPWRPERNAEFLDLDAGEAMERTGGRLPGFLPRDDDSWESREHNRRHGRSILAEMVGEAGDYALIGEDLGVVPEYVGPTLAELGIAGFKVPMWENDPEGNLIPGASYPRLSVTTFATHDHPPVRVFWNEWAEAIRRGGEADADDAARARAESARRGMGALLRYAGLDIEAGAMEYDDAIREALLGALFASNAWLAIPMITDVFGAEDRFNVPGAVADSNWSHRMRMTVSQWRDDPEISARMEAVRKLIRKAGRL